jgi:protease PrsW
VAAPAADGGTTLARHDDSPEPGGADRPAAPPGDRPPARPGSGAPPVGSGAGRPIPPPPLPPVDYGARARRAFGCGCFGCGGLFFLFGMALFLVSAVPNPVALTIAAIAAVMPVPFYSWVILQLDRYEAEPWQILAGAFLWGALGATFISAILNSLIGAILQRDVGEAAGELLTSVLVAPVVEEAAKGAALLVLFVIARREFDNVLDGIIYGMLIGLGFAMTENILYFGRIYLEGGVIGVGVLFYVRVLLGGFGHALYTGTTGAAVGFARETHRRALLFVLPPLGYLLAVLQHAAWNGIGATIVPAIVPQDLNPLVLLFVVMPITSIVLTGPGLLALLFITVLAWRRESQVIRTFLADEVGRGVITPDEYAHLPSLRRRFSQEVGALRRRGVGAFFAMRDFHQVATDLAFRKWHVSRGDHPTRGPMVAPEELYRQRLAVIRTRLTAPRR